MLSANSIRVVIFLNNTSSKASKARYNTDIDTHTEEELPEKRRRIHRKISSESSSGNENESVLSPFPPVPTTKLLGKTQCSLLMPSRPTRDEDTALTTSPMSVASSRIANKRENGVICNNTYEPADREM